MNNKKALSAILVVLGWFPATAIASVSVALSAPQVQGGASVQARVTLAAPAPAGGLTVQLASSTSAVTFADPATNAPLTRAQFAAGTTRRDLVVRTTPVGSGVVAQLTVAAPSGKAAAVLTVLPPAIQALQVGANQFIGGNLLPVSVTLNARAPREGYAITFSSKTLALDPNARLVVPGGATGAAGQIPTLSVGTAIAGELVASAATTTATARVSQYPPAITAVSVAPQSVAGLSTFNLSVTASHPAPRDGLSVALRRATPSPLVELALPPTVLIPGGRQAVTVPVTVRAPNSASASEMLVATTASGSAQAPLTIEPLRVISYSVTPQVFRGGDPITVTVTRNGTSSDPTDWPVTISSRSGCRTECSPVCYLNCTGLGFLANTQVQMGPNVAVSLNLATRTVDRHITDGAVGYGYVGQYAEVQGVWSGTLSVSPLRVTAMELRRRVNGATQSELLVGAVESGEEIEVRGYLEAPPNGAQTKYLRAPWASGAATYGFHTASGDPVVVGLWLAPATTVAGEAVLKWTTGDDYWPAEASQSVWVNAVPESAYTLELYTAQAGNITSIQGGATVYGRLRVAVPPNSVGSAGLPRTLESSNPPVASVPAAGGITLRRNSGGTEVNGTFAISTRAVGTPTEVVIKAGGTPGDWNSGTRVTLTVLP